jgi:hypothetical protein
MFGHRLPDLLNRSLPFIYLAYSMVGFLMESVPISYEIFHTLSFVVLWEALQKTRNLYSK